MKSIFVLIAVVIASTGLRNSPANNLHAKQNPKGFAVVELFTSEGCSSCPPADEAVTEVAKEYAENIFVIGFHVDYWDNLGWKDRFSDHSYSERQKQYASIFNSNSIYTPQVVVNGKKEFVGSDRNQLEKSTAAEIKSTRNLSIDLSAESSDNKTINVNCKPDKNTAGILNIALIQRVAETNVKRGENSGKELRHINVARAFKSFDLKKVPSERTTFEIPSGLSKKDCAIIAYIQDRNNFQITAAEKTDIK